MDIKKLLHGLVNEFREQNPTIPQQKFDEIVSQISERVENEPPPTVAIIGESGVGKSSTVNALFNAGHPVSHTEACTQAEAAVELKADTVHGERGILVVYDMPGLGESLSKRGQHLQTYERVLKDADVALWILDAQYRAVESVQRVLTEEMKSINPGLVERMVFALNKVDLVHPGETDWHPLANMPSEEQDANIAQRILDVERKVREAVPRWKGSVIGYSAAKRYNLPQLFAVMLEAVPKKRQWVLASRKALADFFELVHPELLPADRRPQQRAHSTGPKVTTGPSPEVMSDQEFAEITKDKDALLAWHRMMSRKSGGDGK